MKPKLKILYDFQDMLGGAPRSQLAHMLAMKAEGHEVIATIGRDIQELRKKAPSVKIIEIRNFNSNYKNPLSVIWVYLNWISLLFKEKPDIIHTNRYSQSLFLSVLTDFFGFCHVFAQAGGVASESFVEKMVDKHCIVYSEENKKDFERFGFNESNISVIPNRIPSLEIHEIENEKNRRSLNIAVIGNMKVFNIDGHIYFLELLRDIEYVVGEVNVYIAGKAMHHNKDYIKKIKDLIKQINKPSKGINVEMVGWVDDINKFISKMDICIGKGRSVIQPAMAKKVCYVLSESGILTRITCDTFSNLYETNFSGRGKQEDYNVEFIDRISSDNIKLMDLRLDAEEVNSKIIDHYHESKAYKKLMSVYNIAVGGKRKRPLFAIKRFFKIYKHAVLRLVKRYR